MLSLVTPNFARDLERAVLAAILTDAPFALGECRAVGLHARHFGERAHQLVYRAFERLDAQGLAIDPPTLAKFLADHNALAEAGGTAFIAELLDEIPTTANVRSHARLVRQATAGPAEARRQGEQDAQVGEALAFLDLGAGAFLRYPFAALDASLGGIAPGRPHWFCAHSGTGKTSLVNTLAKHWALTEGKRVMVAGLELEPKELRLSMACRVLGVDHGELFKGNLQRTAQWADTRAQLVAELHRQRTEDAYREHLRFAPFERLTAENTRAICEEAAAWNADVVFIDHVDHMDTVHNGGRERAESLAIVQVLNSLVKSYGLRCIATSQTNREGKANNPLRDHYPLSSEMVRHGDHKLQEAGAFCGLRRPIRKDVEKEALSDARHDRAKIPEILAPHTMAVNVMKDRYGHATGEDLWLGFWRGEVLDDPSSTHAIPTRRYRHDPPPPVPLAPQTNIHFEDRSA